jgi:hypothetical protein
LVTDEAVVIRRFEVLSRGTSREFYSCGVESPVEVANFVEVTLEGCAIPRCGN